METTRLFLKTTGAMNSVLDLAGANRGAKKEIIWGF